MESKLNVKFNINPKSLKYYPNKIFPNTYVEIWQSSTVAGLTLGLAGFLFLSIQSFIPAFPILIPFIKIISAIAFSYGLLDIVLNKRCLYTGKIGATNILSKENWLQLLMCLVSNLFALSIVACCLVIINPNLILIANTVVETKLIQTWYQLLLSGIGCGIFMYLAVNSENKAMIMFSVAGFILCGFEHCLADWFYFCISNYTIPFGKFLLILLGNTIGANLIRLIKGELINE